MKIILGLFALLLAIVFGILYFQNNFHFNFPIPFFGKSSKVTIDTHVFNVTLANTPQEKETGLSGKTSLSQDSGMLFPFDKPDYYSFWMKNMKIAIDMIYINNDKVVTVFGNLQPPKSADENLSIYKPDEPADKVLEINAGLSEKYGIKKGDTVTFENIK